MAPTQARKHPTPKQLSDFVNGYLSPKSQLAVEKHVEKCSECVLQLESVAGDTLGDRIKSLATHFDEVTSPESDDDSIPEQLVDHDRYELIERIGTGGMGDVFRAKQRVMNRPVAIKVLRRHLFENDRAIARFQNEVRVAAQLNHPNIVHSYDAEVSRGLNILVMEFVDGVKLSDLVSRDSPFTPLEASRVVIEISKGLEYAHQQGMIHRDVKPQNIMVMADWSIKITDFGLGKFVRDSVNSQDHSLTFEGETFGTPDYIAPEQIRNSSEADYRSDIYSLGCTMYFMLTGQPPFANLSVGEKLVGHLEKQPVSIRELRPNLPDSFAGVVEQMMEKQPTNRFNSYRELINRLEPLKETDFTTSAAVPMAVPVSVEANDPTEFNLNTQLDMGQPERKPESSRRAFALITIAAVLALLLGGGIYSWTQWNSIFGTVPNDDGYVDVAIVLPFKNAYHPEIVELNLAFQQHENVRVHYISEETGEVKFNSLNQKADPVCVQVERTLGMISADEFDAVIFTGGWNGKDGTTTRYAYDKALNLQAKKFVEAMLEQKKPVASVCGGTAVLAFAGILNGKRAASCQYIRDAMKVAGAKWTRIETDSNKCIVVRDGLLITGGNAKNMPEIVQTMMGLIEGKRL